ncbi:MAG: DeoR/GlpR family DNA-binding transcription regulator [Desulfobacterales bacterium]|nr:DeoR/GlpR family DNA-binding transcription regulator [Desulfobacterales bacterium]MDX2510500.1 DeoR/GlpR family DNA-binding transcription regulator [Desulfobacterales bacterium]
MKNSASLLPAERQQRILAILSQEFTARSSTLSEILGVSEMTIRRDFDILERRGLVERTHGGAVFKQERVAGKFQYQSSIKENLQEKQQIARRAASLLEPNDVIFLGEGTTAALILKYLEPGFPCTIFTNNLGVVAETDHISAELVMLGGNYNSVTHALSGPLTMQMIRQVNATKVFLGADALSISAGMTTPNFDIAIIDRSMIENTRGQVVVLANHTKFGLVAQMSVAPLKQIDVLITNRKIPEDFQNDLNQLGVDVLVG